MEKPIPAPTSMSQAQRRSAVSMLRLLLATCILLSLLPTPFAQSSTGASSPFIGHWESATGNCSQDCGPGLRFTGPVCVLNTDSTTRLEDSFCNSTDTSKPTAYSEYCNLHPCVVTLTAWRIVDHRSETRQQIGAAEWRISCCELELTAV